MGKYMRKAKITADVAVLMDVSHQSSLGVRTRAKTLALQRLQATTAKQPPSGNGDQNPELSYLQLRSRRLEKPNLQLPTSCCKPKIGSRLNPSPRATSPSVGSLSVPSFANKKEDVLGEIPSQEGEQTMGICAIAVEVSLGENNLDFEGKERSTRESTPCSLIRDSSTLSTPGSSTRPTNLSANRRTWNSAQRIMPTRHEIEEFFARAEEERHQLFADRYNFDVVNEVSLPGRYEWVRVEP